MYRGKIMVSKVVRSSDYAGQASPPRRAEFWRTGNQANPVRPEVLTGLKYFCFDFAQHGE